MTLNADNWEVIGASEAKLEARRDEAAKLAGELLAVIRLNHANDRFSVCSSEQLEEFLKPYDARLRAIQPKP